MDDRARPKRGRFQNKSFENSYFRRAPCVELWGERGLPGVPLISPEDSRASGLRLVCRFEHVFSAPPHHVPVVDPRHRWGGGGQQVKKNTQKCPDNVESPLKISIHQKDLISLGTKR